MKGSVDGYGEGENKTEYLVFYAELHQGSWISACSPMFDAEAFHPFPVLLMCHNRHAMALLLQSLPKRNIGLYISATADGQANEMHWRTGEKCSLRDIYHFKSSGFAHAIGVVNARCLG